MNAPDVVIPFYGDPAETLALIESLRTQSLPPAQIIVSDDASPMAFPDTAGVTVLRRERNGGFGSAVNTGLSAVTADAALVLNSDLTLEPTFIADLIEVAGERWPAVLSPHVRGHDGETQWAGRHFPTVGHQFIEWLTPLARWRPRLHDAVGHDTRCVPGTVTEVDWVVGAAMLLPVAQVREVGGFDEEFFMNGEEVDLQRRLREIGVPSVYAGTVSVTHEGGGSSDPERRRKWLVDARSYYARKWGGARRLRAALTFASFVNFIVNGARQLFGRDVHAVQVLRQELGYLKQQGRVGNKETA